MDQDIADIEAPTTNGVAPDIFQKMRNRPVTLKFEDVVYKIKTKKQGLLILKKVEKEKIILKGVTGMIEPGEVLALLGPSGSGKTTLLTTLGGRLGGGNLQGTITYNGDKFSNSMKRNIGFVTQDDILHPHLTVTETLLFTALLRLPNSFTKQDKILQAKSVITQLGLTNCKDTIIGDAFLRGISGGERKRVSIGQEILVNPRLLLLDEPTSGLDSSMAKRIVSCLWELANKGKTIVMTIHQPSSRLYYMFHKVMLLSEGSSVYFGKGSEAIKYFSSIGFSPDVAMNPGDFLLDLANGVYYDESTEDHVLIKSKLKSGYMNHIEPQLKALLHEREDSDQSQQDRHQDIEFGRWPTSWRQQFFVLLRRGVKERRHDSFSGHKIAQILLVAIISGLLWYKSDISHLQDQMGLLFIMVDFWGFIPLFEAIFAFPPERMMLQKERSSGTYRLSSYFMSRIVADLPMEIGLPTIFLIITYWMAGLKPNLLSFLYTLLTLLFTVLVSQGLGLALGALLMDQKTATTLGSVMMISFMLTGGFYVQNVPKFIAWIKYLSISYYTFKLFVGSQYGVRDTYPCSKGQCLVADFPSIKNIGVGLKGQMVAALALGIMLVGYRLLAYFALMRIGVTK